jgi:hypothetical protein
MDHPFSIKLMAMWGPLPDGGLKKIDVDILYSNFA